MAEGNSDLEEVPSDYEDNDDLELPKTAEETEKDPSGGRSEAWTPVFDEISLPGVQPAPQTNGHLDDEPKEFTYAVNRAASLENVSVPEDMEEHNEASKSPRDTIIHEGIRQTDEDQLYSSEQDNIFTNADDTGESMKHTANEQTVLQSDKEDPIFKRSSLVPSVVPPVIPPRASDKTLSTGSKNLPVMRQQAVRKLSPEVPAPLSSSQKNVRKEKKLSNALPVRKSASPTKFVLRAPNKVSVAKRPATQVLGPATKAKVKDSDGPKLPMRNSRSHSTTSNKNGHPVTQNTRAAEVHSNNQSRTFLRKITPSKSPSGERSAPAHTKAQQQETFKSHQSRISQPPIALPIKTSGYKPATSPIQEKTKTLNSTYTITKAGVKTLVPTLTKTLRERQLSVQLPRFPIKADRNPRVQRQPENHNPFRNVTPFLIDAPQEFERVHPKKTDHLQDEYEANMEEVDADVQKLVDYTVNDSKYPPQESYWHYLLEHSELQWNAKALQRMRRSRSAYNRTSSFANGSRSTTISKSGEADLRLYDRMLTENTELRYPRSQFKDRLKYDTNVSNFLKERNSSSAPIVKKSFHQHELPVISTLAVQNAFDLEDFRDTINYNVVGVAVGNDDLNRYRKEMETKLRHEMLIRITESNDFSPEKLKTCFLEMFEKHTGQLRTKHRLSPNEVGAILTSLFSELII